MCLNLKFIFFNKNIIFLLSSLKFKLKIQIFFNKKLLNVVLFLYKKIILHA